MARSRVRKVNAWVVEGVRGRRVYALATRTPGRVCGFQGLLTING